MADTEASELTREELDHLLRLAGVVITWTTQDTLKPGSAGYPHLIRARQEFLKARLEMKHAHGQLLTSADAGGCTCGGHEIRESCMYHYAARLQPDNHRIPWNCPTFYDGCNCEKAG